MDKFIKELCNLRAQYQIETEKLQEYMDAINSHSEQERWARIERDVLKRVIQNLDKIIHENT
jgi:hypothetical protein